MSDATTETLSERALVDAKIKLDNAIEEYTHSQRLGQENILLASEQLHTAVLGLWWRMQTHLKNGEGWKNVQNIDGIDFENIFSGQHPQTGKNIEISGLKDLGDWIDRSMTVREDVSGPNSSQTSSQRQISVRLPSEAAINAAEALLTRYHDFGWGLESYEDDGDAEFDYEDILQTGPPGGEKPVIETNGGEQ